MLQPCGALPPHASRSKLEPRSTFLTRCSPRHLSETAWMRFCVPERGREEVRPSVGGWGRGLQVGLTTT